jgi:hypothetical protein
MKQAQEVGSGSSSQQHSGGAIPNMGVLGDFFIANESSHPTYDPGPSFPAEDRCQFKAITPLEAAGFLSVLRGDGDPLEVIDEFPLLTPQDAEEWIVSIPPDMPALLRELNASALVDVARRCADVTRDELGWSPGEIESVLRDLSQLSRRADETGKRMYLWNSL